MSCLAETRTFARMITSLVEEAEAIGWYEQRISVEKDAAAKAIMENAQQEEFKHFAMDLEFLLRRNEEVADRLRGRAVPRRRHRGARGAGGRGRRGRLGGGRQFVPEALEHLGLAGLAGAEDEQFQPSSPDSKARAVCGETRMASHCADRARLVLSVTCPLPESTM